MDMELILEIVAAEFNLDLDSIAKKKYGTIPQYLVRDILKPIIESGRASLTEVFPNMSRPTILRVLSEILPNKPKNNENWHHYILHSAGLHRCSKCTAIKYIKEFSENNTRYSGVNCICKACDSIHNKIYRDNNFEKEQERSRTKYANNKEYYIAKSIAYKRNVIQKRPLWANVEELHKIYKYCPEGHHVDHIIPLNGESVCGLHVEHNLQYLLAKDNISKGNTFIIDKYIHTTEYIPPYKL